MAVVICSNKYEICVKYRLKITSSNGRLKPFNLHTPDVIN